MGWHCRSATLTLADGVVVACYPLVRTIATSSDGVEAEVIDLGRGTPEEFEAHSSDIGGRIVLVRHELMFAAGTMHRRRKYDMARAAGAVGFLIAGPLGGGAVAGSSGRGEGGEAFPHWASRPKPQRAWRAAPQAGHAYLAHRNGRGNPPKRARCSTTTRPGRRMGGAERARGRPRHRRKRHGQRVRRCRGPFRRARPGPARRWRRAAFALRSSAPRSGRLRALRAMSRPFAGRARRKIALNVNLDSVAGSSRLAALTSGYARVEPFLLAVAEANRALICAVSDRSSRTQIMPTLRSPESRPSVLWPAMTIPARICASCSRLVIRATRSRNASATATLSTAALVAAACNADPADAARWRRCWRDSSGASGPSGPRGLRPSVSG